MITEIVIVNIVVISAVVGFVVVMSAGGGFNATTNKSIGVVFDAVVNQ